ncbi:MAG: Gfo/Idh/MocA family oxidoreductase [Calditrichia bacterium]
MIPEKIKIGVVGVGHLGRWHVQQLKAIPQAELIGIYDNDSERSKSVAAEFGSRSFPDFEKLLAETDAVSIVTPTTSHFDYTMQALESGKHVFIEKPITETVEQGEKLVGLAAPRDRCGGGAGSDDS